MVRLAISAALLMIVIGLAEASMYQTIITNTEFDEPNPSQSDRCHRQLSGISLSSYRSYLVWPRTVTEVKQGCCQDLRGVKDPKCRCEVLRKSVSCYGQQAQQEAEWKVQQLAQDCRMQELRSCRLRGQQAGF